MGKLDGKAAVIVGASNAGGMGQSMAQRFMAEGAQVLVSARHAEGLEKFAGETGCHWATCDLTRKADVFALVDTAREKMGKVDIGVNSTGVALGGPFEDFSEVDLDTVLALMFKGPFFLFQALVRAMDQGGSIIEISSGTAQKSSTVKGYDAYMGAKAGIDHVVRCIANYYGDRGIRANSIIAGHTDTPLIASVLPDWRKAAYADATPLGRYGTVEDIAAAAVWLASDECFMTGEMLQVNGGLTLRRNPLPGDIERYEREWTPGAKM